MNGMLKRFLVIGAGCVVFALAGATITALVVNHYNQPITSVAVSAADRSLDRPQFTGTGTFVYTLVQVTGVTGKTNDYTQGNDAVYQVTAENNRISSTKTVEGRTGPGDIQGAWVESRSVTYQGNQLLVDTYAYVENQGEIAGEQLVSAGGIVVVQNRTTGITTIRQTYETVRAGKPISKTVQEYRQVK